jgi:hypothetical protein
MYLQKLLGCHIGPTRVQAAGAMKLAAFVRREHFFSAAVCSHFRLARKAKILDDQDLWFSS